MARVLVALVLLFARPTFALQVATAEIGGMVEVGPDARSELAVERLRDLQERRRIPGLAAGVGVGGAEVWSAAIGVADLESRVVLDPDAVFPIGSTSKALTALLLGNKWAAGGLVSTPRELVKLGNAVLADKVVRAETFELLATPQRLANGADSGAGYGMGLRSGTTRLSESGPSVRVVHHGGTAAGAMSFFVLLPEHDLVESLQGNLLFEPFSEFAAVAYALAEVFPPDGASAVPGPVAR